METPDNDLQIWVASILQEHHKQPYDLSKLIHSIRMAGTSGPVTTAKPGAKSPTGKAGHAAEKGTEPPLPRHTVSVPDAVLLKAAAASGSEQRHAQSLSGFDEVHVQGGERQFPALREFEIGRVVQGE